MGWTRTGGKNTGHCHLPANLIAYAMDCQELKTWLHTWMHRHQWLHIQAKNQTVHWAFRAALCTVSLKECQRAFTSPPLSQSIDSTLFCLLSKKQRRLLLYCVCVSVCEWMLFIIVHSPISPGCYQWISICVCATNTHTSIHTQTCPREWERSHFLSITQAAEIQKDGTVLAV